MIDRERREILDGVCIRALEFQRAGRLGEASSLYKQVLAQDGRHAGALLSLGVLEGRSGHYPMAARLIRRALAVNGPNPSALINLGVVLGKLGQPSEEEDCYRQALALNPGQVEAAVNLSISLRQAGRYPESLVFARMALEIAPDEPTCQIAFIAAAVLTRDPPGDEGMRAILLRALVEAWVEPEILAGVVLAVLTADSELAALIEAGNGSGGADSDSEEIDRLWTSSAVGQLAEDRLFFALAERTPLYGGVFGPLLTKLRHGACRAQSADDDESVSDRLGLSALLAAQCFLSDYALPETEPETLMVDHLVEQIEGELAQAGTADPMRLALVAAYRPLHRLVGAERLALAALPAAVAGLVRAQVTEVHTEWRLCGSLPCLTGDAGKPVSDGRPSPRWASRVARVAAQPLSARIFGLFPYYSPVLPAQDRAFAALVAGCGTGRPAIAVALRHPDAQVLAIDSCGASLAYGMRKTAEHGVKNITYARADILGLAALKQRFALIECLDGVAGLSDPLAGVEALAGGLDLGGYLRLGVHQLPVAGLNALIRRLGLAFVGFEGVEPGLKSAYMRRFPKDPEGGRLENWCRLTIDHPALFEGRLLIWLQRVQGP
ncbi:MAG: tetratricopeptide repeat protein [Rhodospirillaceae bacterium]